MTTKKIVLPPIAGTDACGAMHTALRKCCDSNIASAAYQLIQLICETRFTPQKFNPWRVYGGLVAQSINECTARGEKLVHPYIGCKLAAVKLTDACYALEKREIDERMPDNARHAMYSLACVFAEFSEDDWTGMASYLMGET